MFLAGVLSIVFLATPALAVEKELNPLNLPNVLYTRGSLANPHTVRIGDIQTREGYVAVLERVYDESAPARMKKLELAKAEKLFKQKKNDVTEVDVVSLMTAEKTMIEQRKFKQHFRVWPVQTPNRSFIISVPAVFSSETPEIVEPEWVLTKNSIVIAQDNADASDTAFLEGDFKTKKLRKAKIEELPEVDIEDSEGYVNELGEKMKHDIFMVDGPEDGEYYRIGQWTIVHKTGDVSVVKYPYGDYILDEDDEETASVNPYMLITGSAGEYFRGYTDGILTLQAGVTETNNIMNNQMPEELTLAAVKKAITDKWDNVSKIEFGTFQVEGKRVRK